jgi:farnesyl-diphosphate farnesyltransferase
MNTKDTDLKICYDLLPKVSRSFALAIEALPEPSRAIVCVSYLLCRIVDTIEDHPSLINKNQFYDLFDLVLDRHGNVDGLDLSPLKTIAPPQKWDDELMQQCGHVFSVYAQFSHECRAILQRNILEMSFGMRGYTAHGPNGSIILKDNYDLDRYCYYVAGTVGNLLTDVFALQSNIKDPLWIQRQKNKGYHFALGLQKTNMIKDVVQDLKRGSVFVPQTWLQDFKITPSDLIQGEKNPKVRHMLIHFIRQACDHMAIARDYIIELPKNPVGHRVFCIWPYVLALDTLRVGLLKEGLFSEAHEIKVSREEMFKMMALTKRVAQHNLLLKLYFNRKLNAVAEAIS